jgi:RNA polymerase sigma factor (sigma-70 family)
MSNSRSESDADLLAALPVDVAAFEAFYDRHLERVTAFAVKRCSSAKDVADAVAQTFVRLLDAAGRYDADRGDPGSFVLGIAANVIRDLHRRGARQRALLSKLSGRRLLDDDDIERIEAAIDAARAARQATAVLDAVPAGEQAMLRMVARGLSPGEAAAELGISSGAGWTRLSRARRRLRIRLTDPKEWNR